MTEPETSIYVHLDESKIDQQIESGTVKLIDNQGIMSNIDLYGAELIVMLPPTAPTGSKVTGFQLIFGEERVAFVELKDSDRRENPFEERIPLMSRSLTFRTLRSSPNANLDLSQQSLIVRWHAVGDSRRDPSDARNHLRQSLSIN